jgi:hypothetical protein
MRDEAHVLDPLEAILIRQHLANVSTFANVMNETTQLLHRTFPQQRDGYRQRHVRTRNQETRQPNSRSPIRTREHYPNLFNTFSNEMQTDRYDDALERLWNNTYIYRNSTTIPSTFYRYQSSPRTRVNTNNNRGMNQSYSHTDTRNVNHENNDNLQNNESNANTNNDSNEYNNSNNSNNVDNDNDSNNTNLNSQSVDLNGLVLTIDSYTPNISALLLNIIRNSINSIEHMDTSINNTEPSQQEYQYSICIINEDNKDRITEMIPNFAILDIERFEFIENPMNDICPITRERFTDDQQVYMISSCKHVFNKSSLSIWMRHNCTCPSCRTTIM